MSKQENSINECVTLNESCVAEDMYEKVECLENCSGTSSSSNNTTASVICCAQEDILPNTSSNPLPMLCLSHNKSSTINYITATDTSDIVNDSTDLSLNLIEPTTPTHYMMSAKIGDNCTAVASSENAGHGGMSLKVENCTKDITVQIPTPTAVVSGMENLNSTTQSVTNKDNNMILRKGSNAETHQIGNSINNNKPPIDNSHVKITLLDEKLWEKFHTHVNEMIVTKDGRRMFPVLKIKIEGLEPSSMYTVTIDFTVSDSHRWKFMNGRWIRGNKEDNIKNSSTYMHCDSPNFGSFWMNNTISFAKLKISNKVSKDSSKIQIHSLFRYLPCIHIYSIDSATRGLTHVITKHFENTEFVAVTAYQNDAITRLKVSYNPFAKAFLDVKRSGNDSPLNSYNNSSGGGVSGHNRDIYKPYDDTYMKTYNSLSSSTSSSNNANSGCTNSGVATTTATMNNANTTNSNPNSSVSAYHKQMNSLVDDSNNYSNLANSVNPFLYQQNLSQDPSNNMPQVMQHHIRSCCNSSTTNTTTNSNTSNNHSSNSGSNNNNAHNLTGNHLTNDLNNSNNNSFGVVNPTNLPHYYDYLQSTTSASENCSLNPRLNMETRNNPLLSFYDNSFKTPNYPYTYQYNCPSNFYYDKAYMPTDNGNYFYAIKTENSVTQPPPIAATSHSNHQSNNGAATSGGVNMPNCNSNRQITNDNIHQYNYNYQNTASFYNKEIKYHDKAATKSNHPSQMVRDDKRLD